MTVLGFDTSHHNAGTPDYHAAKAAGYVYVWMKASEGQHGRDDTFHDRVLAAHAAGLHVGAYHFGRPGNVPEDDATNFLAAVKGLPLDLPHVLDLEVSDGETPAHITQWAETFLPLIAKPKQPARIYSMDSWFRRGQPLAKLDAGRWVARPTRDPSVPFEVWQHGTRDVPGVGHVDFNEFPGDLGAFLHAMGLAPTPTPPGGTGYSKVTRSDVWRSFGKPRDSKCANGYVFSHARHLSWEQDVSPLNPGLNVKSLHLGHYVRTR